MGQPQTDTRSDHGLSIRVDGMDIGRIQVWAPSQSRAVRHEYEINAITSGGVYENIPGTASNLVVNVSRYDLYTQKFEQAWGRGFDISMLTDQTNPFQVWERWESPTETPAAEVSSLFPRRGFLRKIFDEAKRNEVHVLKELYIYTGCWFENLGRTHTVTGDRIVNVDATLRYVRKYRAA